MKAQKPDRSRVLIVGLPKTDPATRRATGEVQEVAFVDERDRAYLERLGLVRFPKSPADGE